MRKLLRIFSVVTLLVFLFANLAFAIPPLKKKKDTFQVIPASITVVNPQNNQVDLRWDDTYIIKWKYSGLRDGHTLAGTLVKIDLYRNGTFLRTIADNVPIGSNNAGTYSWDLLHPETALGIYKIQIQSKSYLDIKAMSGNLTVVNIPT